jgi:hypothetical protein
MSHHIPFVTHAEELIMALPPLQPPKSTLLLASLSFSHKLKPLFSSISSVVQQQLLISCPSLSLCLPWLD